MDSLPPKEETFLYSTSAFTQHNSVMAIEPNTFSGNHPFILESSKDVEEDKKQKQNINTMNSKKVHRTKSFYKLLLKNRYTINKMVKKLEQLKLNTSKLQQQYLSSLIRLKTLKNSLQACPIYHVAMEEYKFQKERKTPIDFIILPPLKLKDQQSQVETIKSQLSAPLFHSLTEDKYDEVPSSFISIPS
ncbi:hypothetical protein EDI_339340 [Entamoeba dispar SAW760]|uniref:Uncharacterized protein n=1 Tax=Entamoeba dispar (strain ATCC PRA-260 / SAW760) TaxID=370354 RepID=B0EDV1_ENTDS|nr:uncharacterized protein EDI_339340 [Entamoeba dispar SAW760]EDR27290.1 hypothetical protein EDI_339340 [Entamoeba dispar SAW760]|eukprot:EDR27290.1 hypothetical protein EDI_339340 [Entamoeba dispar SAW760]